MMVVTIPIGELQSPYAIKKAPFGQTVPWGYDHGLEPEGGVRALLPQSEFREHSWNHAGMLEYRENL